LEGMQEELQRAVPLAKYRLEAVVASHELDDPAGRGAALREAAEIVNDIADQIERDGYVDFLVDTLLSLERGVSYGEREKRRGRIEGLVRSELEADQTRQGRQERARAARSGQAEGARSSSNVPFGSSAQGTLESVANEARVGSQSVRTEIGEVRPRWVSPRQQEKIAEQEKSALDLRESAARTLGLSAASGVVKAERALLAILLSQPARRVSILEHLPLALWTSELHAEIVVHARDWPSDDIDPSSFTDGLSSEAQSLVAELFLGDEAAQAPEERVVKDWIERVKWHHAQNAEREMFELIKGKIERGEAVSSDEKELLSGALTATRRKMPVEKK